jgi:serine/threonine-protein kinase RsbW
MEPLDVESAGPSFEGQRFPIDISFPSDVRHIERIVSVVVQQCAEHQFSHRAIALNVPVALTEALSNAIRYGNGRDPEKDIRLRGRIDDRLLVLEVVDQGDGFDMKNATCDPTAPENLTREDGRGLYLMRVLMDRVEQFSEGGNVVRLVLRRS